MRYANLHSHTDYSNTRLIDSIIKIAFHLNILKRINKIKMIKTIELYFD